MKFTSCSSKQGEGVAATGRAITKINPHWAGFTEMDMGERDSLKELQANLPKHKLLFVKKPGKSRSAECPIAFRKSRFWRVEGVEAHQLSPDLNNSSMGLDNERTVTVVRYSRVGLRGRVKWKGAALAFHLNGAIQDPKFGSLRGTRAAQVTDDKAMPMIESLIRTLHDENRSVQATADTNWNALLPQANTWQKSPDAVARRQNLEVIVKHFDRLFFSKKHPNSQVRWVCGSTTIEPPLSGNNTSDHPRITVTIKRKRFQK